jgi:acyl-CoA reductase-like NAD-dependent aldehyde dehydrogenase
MGNITAEPVSNLVQQQRAFFRTGQTQELKFRIDQLKRLRQTIADQEDAILAALKTDLNKPAFESYFAEIRLVTEEIDYAVKHLRSWAKPRSVAVPSTLQPAKATVRPEPLGVVLIIAPWNYPFQLVLAPLVAALAAGNCAVLKPSELVPNVSRVVAAVVEKTFEPDYVAVMEGGIDISQALLAEKFDHIFFTGGTAIGKVVMQAAANHLTPVTLELGGKSPCIVDVDVPIQTTAKRIAWGKFLNAGQTCVAPDYLLVDRRIKSALMNEIQVAITQLYGDNPAHSPDYGRIVNDKHFNRLVALLETGNIIVGGKTDAKNRYISPTVLDQITWNDLVMQEEIFGPILPVLEYTQIEEAIEQIQTQPKPLALYLFSRNPTLQQQVLQSTSSGGVAINDTIMQSAVTTLPFGGVGDSGMGQYHGKAGFDTFSHTKSIVTKPFWPDLPFRYPPYGHKLDRLRRWFG